MNKRRLLTFSVALIALIGVTATGVVLLKSLAPSAEAKHAAVWAIPISSLRDPAQKGQSHFADTFVAISGSTAHAVVVGKFHENFLVETSRAGEFILCEDFQFKQEIFSCVNPQGISPPHGYHWLKTGGSTSPNYYGNLIMRPARIVGDTVEVDRSRP